MSPTDEADDEAGPPADRDPVDVLAGPEPPREGPGPVARGAALVTAGGLVVLAAGTVVTLIAGGCVLDRTTPFGGRCTGVVREPWFGLVALVTVAAALVGSVLGIRDHLAGEGWD